MSICRSKYMRSAEVYDAAEPLVVWSDNRCHREGELPPALSYEKMKKEWNSMKGAKRVSDNERLGCLVRIVWAYNDLYNRGEKRDVPAAEKEYMAHIIEQLLAMDMTDDVFRAELLRENGEFEKAIELLHSISMEGDYIGWMKKKFCDSYKKYDTRPFIIQRKTTRL